MTWTAPRTWSVGDLVTASMMNANVRDNLLVAHAPVVTALPGSPFDEQRVYLVDSTTAPTYGWTLVYDATLAAWRFAGGTPAHSENTTNETISSTSGAYFDFANPVSFTVPRAGSYLVACHAEVNSGGTGTMLVTLKRGAAALIGADVFINAGAPGEAYGFRTIVVTGLAASAVLKLQWAASWVSGAAPQSKWRSIDVWPVTVT